MINSTRSLSFGSSLIFKDSVGKKSGVQKNHPLTSLSQKQKAELKKLAAPIGPPRNMIVLNSTTRPSEVMTFHEISAEYLAHNPDNYTNSSSLLKQRNISGNFMDDKSVLGHKNTLADEVFIETKNLLKKIAKTVKKQTALVKDKSIKHLKQVG